LLLVFAKSKQRFPAISVHQIFTTTESCKPAAMLE
jgi:hypothetical protein